MSSSARMPAQRLAVLVLLAAAIVAGTVAEAFGESTAEQLARLKKEVSAAGKAYEKAYWKLDEAEVRLNKLDREMAASEKELAEARAQLSGRVNSMYRSSLGLGFLDIVLGSDSFEDMVTRFDFMYRIGRADAEAIAAVRNLDAKVSAQRAELARETRNKEAALSELQKERDALKKQMDAKQKQYDKLRASSKGSTLSGGTPKGSLGMVFPVRGVCHYSDTWGASRGGGRRRHKGTDIMAARGVPIVAVLSGKARTKTGGIGGKTIWLSANNGWAFYYAHLDGYAISGGSVSRGQVIGYNGSTGNAAGGSPHLHFQMHPGGGSPVNPYPYLRACE